MAKNVFQVHAADADGSTAFNRKIKRADLLKFFAKLPPCLVGLEACSTAHHWGRRIAEFGHEVRLIHPAYVKPFVKRGKTDFNDAEAINEALTRKTMRFVPVKSAEQQASAIIFRTRTLVVRQRTQAINALRSHLAEFGVATAQGTTGLQALIAIANDEQDDRIPASARFALHQILRQIEFLEENIARLDREIKARTKHDDDVKRLMTIPGVGPISAIAIKTLVPDPGGFKSARHFAAWIGLTPKSHSSGESQVLGNISRMGNGQLRALLVTGAMSVLASAKTDDKLSPWLAKLRKRRPFKVAAVALANKTARIVWALLVRGGNYTKSGSSVDVGTMA
ncbi:IS110 family transposase [Rhizobium brockwellii]|uniref:IS110 family transposase n=1 Tax=Rhizobium brockwellii TaxID=3019932 RepID=A0ABU3YVJ1_9HYPH|nr:IS110 family transposase [Rhizobium brockwellii]MDV4182961.1 IS110 family transposase [Rhizobium brockwellii]MDV4189865.1 IS110 family transposase [Rhizobium brockwellii]